MYYLNTINFKNISFLQVGMEGLILQLYKKGHSYLSKSKAIKYSNVFRPLRRLNKFLIGIIKSDYAVVLGHKMFLGKDSLRLSTRGVYEPFITKMLQDEIKEGDTVLDLGANIGYHTLLFARQVGERGKVYAFEPDPINFQLLKKNVEVNGYKNVIMEQKAVSNKSGFMKLYQDKDSTTSHSLRRNDSCSNIFNTVEVIRLDEYLGSEKVNFIKIDVEGAEHHALEGMGSLLKNPMKIMAEFSPSFLKNFGIDPNDFIQLLNDNGFNLIYNVNEKEEIIEPFNVQDFSVHLSQRFQGAVNTNMLCIKENNNQ